MLNLFRNLKYIYVLCLLIKLYVAEYTNGANGNFAFELEVNNETEYNITQHSDEDNFSSDYSSDSRLYETVFDFSETFSEQNMTDLLHFLYENRRSRIETVHNKTIRIDCENPFFTTLRLERIGEHQIKLECTEDVIKNAVNVCIQQKANIWLAESYIPIEPGTFVRMNIFPHMVAIGYPPISSQSQENNTYSFECGGSLISDKFVLTAAHCFKKKLPVIIRLGVNYIKQPTPYYDLEEALDVNIWKIYKHPLYKKKRKYNDIALIELENPIELSPAIYPACLGTTNDTADGIELFVCGWGVNEEDQQEYNLQYGKMTTLSRSECTENYRKLGLKNAGIPNGVLESQMCAGNFTSRIIDTCRGDSGGPIQSQPGYGLVSTIYGITSFGLRCGTDPPSIFIRVSYYRDWIESIVWPRTNDTIPT